MANDSSRLAHKNVLSSSPDYKSRRQRWGETFPLPLSYHEVSVSASHSSLPYRQRPENDPMVRVPGKSVILDGLYLKRVPDTSELSCVSLSSFHEVSQHTKLRLVSWRKPTSLSFPFLSPTLVHWAQL